jgi:hypothetical protein
VREREVEPERERIEEPEKVPAVTDFVSIEGDRFSVCDTCGSTIRNGECPVCDRPEFELAFDTEPIIGWRVWRIVPFQRRGGVPERRLTALANHAVWTPMMRAEAWCIGGAPHRAAPHEAPWPDCMCGVWALHTREDAEEKWATTNGELCIGAVALWGRVLEFEHGYRAQYAYPQELIFLGGDGQLAAEVGQLYGVPVRTVRAPEKKPREWPSRVSSSTVVIRADASQRIDRLHQIMRARDELRHQQPSPLSRTLDRILAPYRRPSPPVTP